VSYSDLTFNTNLLETFEVGRRLIMVGLRGHDATESSAGRANKVLHSLRGAATFVTTEGAILITFNPDMHGFLDSVALIFFSWGRSTNR
jgi:hypothetical protein